MDQKLVRIRELIDQKEAVDAELASLIGGATEAPKRGRPRKPEGSAGEPQQANGAHPENAGSD
jgi:hypothetical protein